MSYSTIAIIYNPNSTGSGERLGKELERQLRKRFSKQEVKLVATEHAGHGRELAYEIAMSSEKPLIISSSGDGGYHDVVNGAMRAQEEGARPTTGLLPAGNANDHYRNLHSEDIISKIERQKPMKIDLLKLTGVSDGKRIELYAHSYIGFGLTPFVGKELNKTKLNAIRESWVVLRSLITAKTVKLKIGERSHRYESVIFSNIDTMSKYLAVSEVSSVSDGKCEVTIFKRRSKFQLLMTLLKASTQGVIEDHSVSNFSLHTVNSTLVQADGEITTLDPDTRVDITVESKILDCIV